MNAVRLAAHPDAVGKGVLATLNDRIHAARDIAKTDAGNLDAFQSPGIGPLGTMVDGEPRFLRQPRKLHAVRDAFSVAGLAALPKVAVIYGHAGMDRGLVDAAVAAKAAGIVYAGVGMGMVHRAALPALAEAAERGVAVVVASRVERGSVMLSPEAERFGFIPADDLNPQKARVLLQVALAGGTAPGTGRLREIFAAY
jgi:L-asparaginase/Glu-tRNA(Gln) amidotransferase subunit D